uniref:Uncharacterized protein n=1 Tax=Cacopsylla melanoneura TaxID=428564 RepID=A0A8D8QG17_9HEMI
MYLHYTLLLGTVRFCCVLFYIRERERLAPVITVNQGVPCYSLVGNIFRIREFSRQVSKVPSCPVSDYTYWSPEILRGNLSLITLIRQDELDNISCPPCQC